MKTTLGKIVLLKTRHAIWATYLNWKKLCVQSYSLTESSCF